MNTDVCKKEPSNEVINENRSDNPIVKQAIEISVIDAIYVIRQHIETRKSRMMDYVKITIVQGLAKYFLPNQEQNQHIFYDVMSNYQTIKMPVDTSAEIELAKILLGQFTYSETFSFMYNEKFYYENPMKFHILKFYGNKRFLKTYEKEYPDADFSRREAFALFLLDILEKSLTNNEHINH